ncbi:hypothetical protein cyc_06297 [Cyclospora cayetanensis]|uniref:Uncharacterized protein n=1 Tax=Cyclospora cayetanensis TaxID=88456 RepID=A0A1D3D0X1_9EIME|nr:hypothetical protein cyc_06297 [Cyclospora cayetanensis]
MAPSPLRPLAAGGPPTLKKLAAQSEVYVHLEKRVHALRKQLFGYARGMPGEAAWLKPLQGKEMKEYYWPSKYDLPSFNMEQYLQMQALRYAPKPTHPSLLSLSRLMALLTERKKTVRHLLSQLDAELLRENPTLQDLYALYKSLFSDDPLSSDSRQKEQPWRWTDCLEAETLLALVEATSQQEGGEKLFSDILKEAKTQCSSLSQLQELLQRLLGEKLTPSLASSLLYLATKDVLVLPAAICSRKSTGRTRAVSDAAAAKGALVRMLESANEQTEAMRAAGNEGRDKALLARIRLVSRLAEAAEGHPAAASSRQQQEGREAKGGLSPRTQESRRQPPSLDQHALGLLGPPGVTVHSVGLAPAETESQTRQRERRQAAAQEELQSEIESDAKLASYYRTSHRFIDPLFKRKRLSFLDRLARSRIKSQTAKEIGAQVYIHHPDRQPSFPHNKGFINRKWPSPYH